MRMYFCTDIHGSERCWKKFLATPKHYECDAIVIGGDITGKFIVPVIETKRGKYKARFAGIERKVSKGPQLDSLLAMIADAAMTAPSNSLSLLITSPPSGLSVSRRCLPVADRQAAVTISFLVLA